MGLKNREFIEVRHGSICIKEGEGALKTPHFVFDCNYKRVYFGLTISILICDETF